LGPLRLSSFRGSIAHPTESLCTLRARRRRRPRNTRYRAPATAYPRRPSTGRNTPACLEHRKEQGIPRFLAKLRRNRLESSLITPCCARIPCAGEQILCGWTAAGLGRLIFHTSMEATDGFYHLRDRCRDHRPGEWYHAVRLARIEQIEMGCDDQQSGQREIFQACGRGRRRRRPA